MFTSCYPLMAVNGALVIGLKSSEASTTLFALKTLTSLNKEVRAFSLSDNSIWSFPSVLPLAITAFGGPEGYFSLGIIAFGAFQFIVPICYYRLGKMEFRESSLLI